MPVMIKILIIEPNARSRRTLQDLLSFMGYAEEAAADCNEGLVIAAEQLIDLIFINGHIAAQDRENLRNLLFAANLDIPVVVYSGAVEATSMLHSADEYVHSPFVASNLNRKIRDVVNSRRLAAAS